MGTDQKMHYISIIFLALHVVWITNIVLTSVNIILEFGKTKKVELIRK